MNRAASSFRLLVEYRRRTQSGQLWVLGEGLGRSPMRGQPFYVEGSKSKTGIVFSIGIVNASLHNAFGMVLDGLQEEDVPVGSILIASEG